MNAGIQRQVVLVRYPEGRPRVDDFRTVTGKIPEPREGEFVSRTLYLSLDPYLRGVISGRHLDSDRPGPRDVLPGSTVSEVYLSRNADFPEGCYVQDANGWQEYGISNGESVRRLDPEGPPLSLALGILGMPGLTAWAGMRYLGRPSAGDRVVVSAASGPVGSMAGQIARLSGATTVGIAGSREKCRIAMEEFGFEHCIDYKRENLRLRLAELCPDGIDLYYDNVAGDTLAAVFANLAIGARIILCGMIDQYNRSGEPPPGPNLGPVIAARAHIHGLVVYDFYEKWQEFLQEARAWYEQGLIRTVEDVSDGLELAPEAFCRLMRGENVGKTLVRVATRGS